MAARKSFRKIRNHINEVRKIVLEIVESRKEKNKEKKEIIQT